MSEVAWWKVDSNDIPCVCSQRTLTAGLCGSAYTILLRATHPIFISRGLHNYVGKECSILKRGNKV